MVSNLQEQGYFWKFISAPNLTIKVADHFQVQTSLLHNTCLNMYCVGAGLNLSEIAICDD